MNASRGAAVATSASSGDLPNPRISGITTRPESAAPRAYSNPLISPSSLMFYDDALFTHWQGDAFIGGLSSRALVRVAFDGNSAHEAARYDMGQRIRDVVQGADGALWLLEDQDDSDGGRLLKLTPKS